MTLSISLSHLVETLAGKKLTIFDKSTHEGSNLGYIFFLFVEIPDDSLHVRVTSL